MDVNVTVALQAKQLPSAALSNDTGTPATTSVQLWVTVYQTSPSVHKKAPCFLERSQFDAATVNTDANAANMLHDKGRNHVTGADEDADPSARACL